MPVSVHIKEDLLDIVETLSKKRAVGVDDVIDELLRKGIDQTRIIEYRDGLPTVRVEGGVKTVTREDVARLMDEE